MYYIKKTKNNLMYKKYYSMMDIIAHAYGAVGIRIRRYFLKRRDMPDLSFINENLCVGGVCSIQSLSRNGIQAILDLREEARDNTKEFAKYSINYLKVGIRDRKTPDKDQLNQILDWIRINVEGGKKVFVHCNLGRGRAPSIAAAYLISQGMDSKNSIKLIKKTRRYAYFNREQQKFLEEFEKTSTEIS